MNTLARWAIALPFLLLLPLHAQSPARSGAALLKTDILGVFAHPDDETGMAATLAYYAHGRGATVANVYCTRGEGGGNMVGTQWGAALGILREAELRDCLAAVGVRYCYFLDQLDWAYTESASATLAKWGQEQTLERLVRFVRTLRPEVMVTMNPAPTPGQHGHHQAAGILATEAFSAAADPTRFQSQITKEGLTVWQTKRLFYSGAATNQVNATITVSEPLADGRAPAQIAGSALANHRSQAFGNFADSPWLRRPQRFLLVKAFGPESGFENDLLGALPSSANDWLTPIPVALARHKPEFIVFRFVPRPAVARYETWVREQGIEHVAARFESDVPAVCGESNRLELEVRNDGQSELTGQISFRPPTGWRLQPETAQVTARPGQTVRSSVDLVPPPDALQTDSELSAEMILRGGVRLQTKTRIHPLPRATVPRAKASPLLDGKEWPGCPVLEIPPSQIVEGKVKDVQDSSGSIRLMHDAQTLFVDVLVRDDVIVTNIAPNDIRGHWRSDSVEICIDPAVGSEHTMGCYKLGIFPWDSTGKVRAARDADANQGPIEETAPSTRVASFRTSDGYRVQLAVPFSEIGLKSGQTRLGFNVIIYDGDKTNAAPGENINKSRIAWAPRAGVQGRPEDWGRLDLE